MTKLVPGEQKENMPIIAYCEKRRVFRKGGGNCARVADWVRYAEGEKKKNKHLLGVQGRGAAGRRGVIWVRGENLAP